MAHVNADNTFDLPKVADDAEHGRAAPLGEKRAYRVCYLSNTAKKRCTAGTISGYAWELGCDRHAQALDAVYAEDDDADVVDRHTPDCLENRSR